MIIKKKVKKPLRCFEPWEHKDFPVVGIGASAGGLEALIELISNLPVDTGMAFILVQHLDPTHPSMSVDIISRSTKLKIQEVENGMRVEPNHVYVIPPNHNMKIRHGILSLSPRTGASGQHMTIDFFFQSLAEAEGRLAIGIILSGTGTDGTRGLEAIRAGGGVTYAQELESAKYKGMPQHAIIAGVVDSILPPEDIAKELARMSARSYIATREKLYDDVLDPQKHSRYDESLRNIFNLLQTAKNVDFSNYKHATIERRIQRRLMVKKSKNLAAYFKFLQGHRRISFQELQFFSVP